MASLKIAVADAEHGRGRAGPAPARRAFEDDGSGARMLGKTMMWISTSPFVVMAAMYLAVVLGGRSVVGESFFLLFLLFLICLVASPVAGILFLAGFGTYMGGAR